MAVRAQLARVEVMLAAGPAARDRETVLARRVPEGLRAGVDDGLRLLVGGGLAHDALPQWFARMTVPPEDSVPPVPWTSAVRTSATCRSPASPRSCRTASISRKIPYMPGWQ